MFVFEEICLFVIFDNFYDVGRFDIVHIQNLNRLNNLDLYVII